MNNPFFSIIIATYNSEKVLARCLTSIENQLNEDFELIVIDGGSTDSTTDMLRANEHVVTKWISEKDNGIYDAWNKGIALAKGEWITFIGSDDYFYETALSDYYEFFRLKNIEPFDFISSKMHLVNKSDKIIKTLGFPWHWKTSRLQNKIAHPGSLHHKSLFERYGMFNTDYKICGDYEFLLRPGNSMKAGFVNKITVRMAQGGVSFNGDKLFKEHYTAVVNTGKLNKVVAKYFYFYQMLKHYIKAGVRKFKIDI